MTSVSRVTWSAAPRASRCRLTLPASPPRGSAVLRPCPESTVFGQGSAIRPKGSCPTFRTADKFRASFPDGLGHVARLRLPPRCLIAPHRSTLLVLGFLTSRPAACRARGRLRGPARGRPHDGVRDGIPLCLVIAVLGGPRRR